MMKLFAVRDVKSDSFGAPMSIASTGLALRGFGEAVLAKGSELGKYPADFMLYEIGSYDPVSGAVKALAVPVLVGTAQAVVDAANKPLVAPRETVETVEEVSNA